MFRIFIVSLFFLTFVSGDTSKNRHWAAVHHQSSIAEENFGFGDEEDKFDFELTFKRSGSIGLQLSRKLAVLAVDFARLQSSLEQHERFADLLHVGDTLIAVDGDEDVTFENFSKKLKRNGKNQPVVIRFRPFDRKQRKGKSNFNFDFTVTFYDPTYPDITFGESLEVVTSNIKGIKAGDTLISLNDESTDNWDLPSLLEKLDSLFTTEALRCRGVAYCAVEEFPGTPGVKILRFRPRYVTYRKSIEIQPKRKIKKISLKLDDGKKTKASPSEDAVLFAALQNSQRKKEQNIENSKDKEELELLSNSNLEKLELFEKGIPSLKETDTDGQIVFLNRKGDILQSFDYLGSSFGGDIPCGLHPVVASLYKKDEKSLMNFERDDRFNLNLKLNDGCMEMPRDTNRNMGSMRNAFVVVSRGGCRFLDKVRNIQIAGAAAAVVVNSKGSPLIRMPAGDLNTYDIKLGGILIQEDFMSMFINELEQRNKELKEEYEKIRNSIVSEILNDVELNEKGNDTDTDTDDDDEESRNHILYAKLITSRCQK
eukprot:g5941.t1